MYSYTEVISLGDKIQLVENLKKEKNIAFYMELFSYKTKYHSSMYFTHQITL